MYGEQLKIMFIGGPNVRKDYHMEEGEEVRITGRINYCQSAFCLPLCLLRPSGSTPNWSLGEGINSMNTHMRQAHICACVQYNIRIISRCTCM